MVILVFLLSVRSTVVTAVSIPLSVVGGAARPLDRRLLAQPAHLGALTIAVGRVVDDSIVVLENIKRHLEYGEEKRTAILTAVREVAGAVTASTLTTVAVFAPIALVGGFVGQLFAPFAITVTVALLASLLVSLTVIPVLAYWFLKPPRNTTEDTRRAAEEKELRSPLQRAYLPVIGFATGKRATRWVTLGLGVLLLLGTFGLSRQLETNFLDDSGQDTLSISQELPAGTGLAGTDAAARQVEGVLGQTEGVGDLSGNAAPATARSPAVEQRRQLVVALDGEPTRRRCGKVLREKFAALGDGAVSSLGAVRVARAAISSRWSCRPPSRSCGESRHGGQAAMTGLAGVRTSPPARRPGGPVQVTSTGSPRRVGLSEAAVGQLVAGIPGTRWGR